MQQLDQAERRRPRTAGREAVVHAQDRRQLCELGAVEAAHQEVGQTGPDGWIGEIGVLGHGPLVCPVWPRLQHTCRGGGGVLWAPGVLW